MKDQLSMVFLFLKSNQSYNYELQKQCCNSMMATAMNKKSKLLSLLYHIVNSQSSPKIDKVADFFIDVHENPSMLDSFKSFISYVDPKQDVNFEGLFNGLKAKGGWGNKTAALFTKNIYLIHNVYNNPDFIIWDDVPKEISANDHLYLPVDNVILSIFDKLDNSIKWDFDKINHTIHKYFDDEQVLIWDDLWFWGFINQKGTRRDRTFEWNVNKYWVVYETDKEIIREVEHKSKEFRDLLTMK